jgi:hypothetical protein
MEASTNKKEGNCGADLANDCGRKAIARHHQQSEGHDCKPTELQHGPVPDEGHPPPTEY